MATNVGKLMVHIGVNAVALQRGLENSSRALQRFSATTNRVMKRMGMMTSLLGAAGMVGAFRYATKTGAQFEQALVTLGGVTRATSYQLDKLKESAKLMGATTEFTASQAAESLLQLARGGFSAEEAMKALPATLDLATAANMDLGTAADLATNALSAMNLPVEELNRVMDVMLGTTNRSNQVIEEMAEAFKYAAPVARAYGYSIEELSGLLGMAAQAGIRGSMAGTSMARALRDANKIAKEYKLSSSDLVDVMVAMRDRGMEDVQIMDLFEDRAAKLVGGLLTNIDAIREFQGELRNVGGESARQAELMRGTLLGVWNELKSTVETIALETFDKYKDDLKSTIKDTTQYLREHKDEFLAYIDILKQTLESVGRVASWGKDQLSALAKAFTETPGYKAVNWIAGLFEPTPEPDWGDVFIPSQEEIDAAVAKLRAMNKTTEEVATTVASTAKAVVDDFEDMGDAATKSTEKMQQWAEAFQENMLGGEAFAQQFQEGIDALSPEGMAAAERRNMFSVGQAFRDNLFGGELFQQRFQEDMKDFVDSTSETGRQLIDWSQTVGSAMYDGFNTFFFDAVTGRLQSLQDYLNSFVNSILSVVSQVAAAQITKSLIPGVEIPGFQHGGLISRPTLAMMGESGPEAVVPVSRMNDPTFWSRITGREPSGSGTPINVTVHVKADEPAAFRNSQAQIATQLQAAVNAARRNM